MYTVQFDSETEHRLTELAGKEGKSPEQLIERAVQEYLEDLEDYYLAESRLRDTLPTIPLKEVVRRARALARLAKYRGRFKAVKFDREELYDRPCLR